MLSNAVKNIMIRVIKKRVTAGEELEDILSGYPKLSEEEKQELREELKENTTRA